MIILTWIWILCAVLLFIFITINKKKLVQRLVENDCRKNGIPFNQHEFDRLYDEITQK